MPILRKEKTFLSVDLSSTKKNRKLKNIFSSLFVLFILFNSLRIEAQGSMGKSIHSRNQEFCTELILEINKYKANKDTVELFFEKYEDQIEQSTFEELESCRCMDSLITQLSKNFEKYKSDPKKKYWDNEGFNLIYKYADKVEVIQFKNELRSNSKLQNLNDSIIYVLERVDEKVSGNRNYILLNEDGYFLKNNVDQGYKEYLDQFDKLKYSIRTRDLILVTFMSSRLLELENEILIRIDKKENKELTLRMIAVLNLLGTSKTAIYLIKKYPNHNLTIPIAKRFYSDKKTKFRDRRKIKKYLKMNE